MKFLTCTEMVPVDSKAYFKTYQDLKTSKRYVVLCNKVPKVAKFKKLLAAD